MVRVSSRERLVRRVRLTAPVLGLALLVSGCSDDEPTPEASGSTTAPAVTSTTGATKAPSASTKPGSNDDATVPPVDTQTPSVAISTGPPVAVGKTSSLSNGVKVQVSKVTSVKVKATGPGDIAGDGVAVHLTVKNTSKKAFDLNGLVVTATYGKAKPASPAGAGNGDLLTGSLKVGRTARGVYVFTVPKAKASSVQIQVSSNASALILIYER